MASRIITLTTDFGSRDGFVAAMKGVILSICPYATLVDISHDIPPHDVAHGAFVIGSASRYFPKGTIHVVVVDPGVGSSRYPLLLVTPNGFFVGPDNGILSYVLLAGGLNTMLMAARSDNSYDPMSPMNLSVPQGCQAYVLNRADYWLGEVSNTFHGRDIFAPVAAHVALGTAHSDLGDTIEEIKVLNIPQPVTKGGTVMGRVIFIDHFGNLVTNIPMEIIAEKAIEVVIAGKTIRGLSQSYTESISDLLAIIGSQGYLEIAVRCGNAAQFLDARVGTRIEVRLH